MRVIRKWEAQMLLDEIAECREMEAETRAAGQQPSTGLASYEMGLRTAAIMLGVVGPFQRKPWPVKVWRRWVRGRA